MLELLIAFGRSAASPAPASSCDAADASSCDAADAFAELEPPPPPTRGWAHRLAQRRTQAPRPPSERPPTHSALPPTVRSRPWPRLGWSHRELLARTPKHVWPLAFDVNDLRLRPTASGHLPSQHLLDPSRPASELSCFNPSLLPPLRGCRLRVFLRVSDMHFCPPREQWVLGSWWEICDAEASCYILAHVYPRHAQDFYNKL